MKKIIKALGFILVCLSFLACPLETKDETSKEIKVNGLKVNGIALGTELDKASLSGKTITWDAGSEDASCGWNLVGLDLSEYNRVRIEFESTEVTNKIIIHNKDYDKWYVYDYPLEPNVFEVTLTGEDANYIGGTGKSIDKSKGYRLIILGCKKDGNARPEGLTTVVKSIEFFKEPANRNANLKIADDVPFKVFWDCYVYDGGVIEWAKPEGAAGWDVQDKDLSAYKKIRIETEGDAPVRIRLMMSDGTHAFYWSKKDTPGIFIANLDGSEAEYYTQNLTAGSVVEKIQLVCEGQTKAGSKTTVKSVSLLTE